MSVVLSDTVGRLDLKRIFPAFQGVVLHWLRSWMCLHGLKFRTEIVVVDQFCGTDVIYFALNTLWKLIFPCIWGGMRLSHIGNLPLCCFFSPSHTHFSFLRQASVEQLRISVAWGIPGNLSLLAVLAECWVIWFV